MIVRALLELAGLRATPIVQADFRTALHSDAVHDALNVKAAILAGHAHLVRLSAAADRAVASGSERRREDIAKAQSEVRHALDDLARRLD